MKDHTLNIPAFLRKGAAYSSGGGKTVKTGAHVEAGLCKNCPRSSFPGLKQPFQTKESKCSTSCSLDCFGRQADAEKEHPTLAFISV